MRTRGRSPSPCPWAKANNDNDVTFDWTTQDGTAVAGSDYQAASGSETISAGDTSIQLTVSITNDTVPEPDETFDVVLSNLSYAQAGDTTGTVTILDNELDFGVTINFAPSGGGGRRGNPHRPAAAGGDCPYRHRGTGRLLLQGRRPASHVFQPPGGAREHGP